MAHVSGGNDRRSGLVTGLLWILEEPFLQFVTCTFFIVYKYSKGINKMHLPVNSLKHANTFLLHLSKKKA